MTNKDKLAYLTKEVKDILVDFDTDLLPIRDWEINNIDCIACDENGKLHFYGGFAKDTNFDFENEDYWEEIVLDEVQQINVLTQVVKYI